MSARQSSRGGKEVSSHEEVVIDEDIVIAVVGVTGSGKSTFIKQLTQDESTQIGDGMGSGEYDRDVNCSCHSSS